MFLIGLTGGIAAGKSTVASLWESLGATVVDADLLAREAVEPDTKGFRAVSEAFPSAIDEDGSLNRATLAKIVFNDESKRKELEHIVHPIVGALSRARITEAKTPIVVYVVPLLVEANVELPFDTVVTVEAPESDQVARMVKHRGMTLEQAKARIANQTSPALRANRANHILNSNQDVELLLRDARKLFESFEAGLK